ncbi:hypothetical protein ACOJIV_07585 [Haloarcula sp. AONF1]
MTTIQEVLLELEWDYMGNPHYVSGHALSTALAQRLPNRTMTALQVSLGMFVPGEHGSYPADHSQAGGKSYMGTHLQPVKSYDDLFLFRDPAQRWLSDGRPRDVHNTHTLHTFAGKTGYSSERIFDQPEAKRASKRTMTWYVHVYCHADESGHLPLAEAAFEGIQIGGSRNYGFGQVSCAETRTIDLETLSYARLEAADAYHIELLSPYVLESEYPGADSQSVPWWWGDIDDVRKRETKLIKGADSYTLRTVDHGQILTYTGSDPIATAKAGVLGVGTHCKYGFGRFRLRPASDDRVPERGTAADGRAD